MLEKRKAQFIAEGLFAEEHKKKIPFLPNKIGIITSPTGAVIRDILHRIQDRFPTHVLLWPVLVQGEKAASQVSEAIAGFNQLEDKPDVIIVARGGGSIEDLWPFNEEIVVRAAYASKIPLISAIGHETDFTLLDFVADLRAPTPTAAAEMAIPVLDGLVAYLKAMLNRNNYALTKFFEFHNNKLLMLKKSLPNYQTILVHFIQRLDDLSLRLTNSSTRYFELRESRINMMKLRLKHPQDIVNLAQQKMMQISASLDKVLESYYHNKCQKFELMSALLNSYSYKKTLSRGFAILVDSGDHALTSTAQAKKGDKLKAKLHDGTLAITVD